MKIGTGAWGTTRIDAKRGDGAIYRLHTHSLWAGDMGTLASAIEEWLRCQPPDTLVEGVEVTSVPGGVRHVQALILYRELVTEK